MHCFTFHVPLGQHDIRTGIGWVLPESLRSQRAEMGIEIYELTLIQRVSKLRRHYHPKSPMFRLIISLLVVNVASALRDSLPVLLLLM